jgi:hypothetical protein
MEEARAAEQTTNVDRLFHNKFSRGAFAARLADPNMSGIAG